MSLLAVGIEAVERGLIPDRVTRFAIRRMCRERLRSARQESRAGLAASRSALLQAMRAGPIAAACEQANRQHYELPAPFFAAMLGPRRKYSCCYFADSDSSLAKAEEDALAETCRHARLDDGQQILELGCGWGSLSFWMAEHYPRSRITAVSNSHSQRLFIERERQSRGLTNLKIITADVNGFSPGGETFDRVVSVEMFEHLRNYQQILSRISSWLRPEGMLLIHIFCHRQFAYLFESDDEADWMGRHFFTGGLMPSADLLQHFGQLFQVKEQYFWNGRHYQRTAAAWLANLDAHRDELLEILGSVSGGAAAQRWINRWRIFLLAVAELFGFAGGEEWLVTQCLMQPVI